MNSCSPPAERLATARRWHLSKGTTCGASAIEPAKTALPSTLGRNQALNLVPINCRVARSARDERSPEQLENARLLVHACRQIRVARPRSPTRARIERIVAARARGKTGRHRGGTTRNASLDQARTCELGGS